jgi:hypothetical protein
MRQLWGANYFKLTAKYGIVIIIGCLTFCLLLHIYEIFVSLFN